ncbi:MAG TPA: AAA family ATPase [Puia sp.]|uniref:ATP-dependent nuclease n=1 Tax=Puia sp. TaxID=2045100 RepID=UPI002C01D004|nr:AAA family ATPase [Puia sp.]HVU98506.1 AAA family ATPase [Puia sp.]
MYVKTLKLSDLRSYPELEMEFSQGINIIAGRNNAGKSTVIRSLYELQNLNSISDGDVRLGRAFAQIHIGLEGISPVDKIKYFFGKNPMEEGSDRCRVQFKIANQVTEKQFVQFLSNKDELSRDFHGLPAEENAHNFIYPFLSKRKLTNYTINSSTQNANAIFDNFQNLALKVQRVDAQPTTRTAYERYCKDILGFLVTAIPTNTGGLSLGAFSLNGAMIPIEAMGDGVVNIVGLLTCLLGENGKLFLMEEPENDLHPAALKKLLQLIADKSAQNQFIISTHSNIVLKALADLKDTRIFYANAPIIDDSTSYIPTAKLNMLDNSPEGRLFILEQLGYSPFDFEFYKGYVILEESSAERLIRDFIVPLFVPQAAGLIRFVAAQGASTIESKFRHMKEIFVHLHLAPIYKERAWVIADGDADGVAAIRSLIEDFKSWDVAHFTTWKKPQFEGYYPALFQGRVEAIGLMKKSPDKQEKKKELLNDVIEWINQHPKEGKASLKESAAEIIDTITDIVAKLRST